MKKNLLNLDLNNLEETIDKLTMVKQLLEDIVRLQNEYNKSSFNSPPQPELMPYIPHQYDPDRNDFPPGWKPPFRIWCSNKGDTDGDTGTEVWL